MYRGMFCSDFSMTKKHMITPKLRTTLEGASIFLTIAAIKMVPTQDAMGYMMEIGELCCWKPSFEK